MTFRASGGATPQRVLMGPGPSDPAPSVLGALAEPSVGHLDPHMLELLVRVREQLCQALGTRNAWTLALSGTGSAGMEASLCNLIEPGDAVLVCAHGYFGARLADIALRLGAAVEVFEGEWGRSSDVGAIRKRVAGRRFKLLCCVHAETSTGVWQPLEPMRSLADELGALLVVDAVTSLGCIPLEVDRERIDVAYSCSQKGLSAMSGLAPITFSPAAQARVEARRVRIPSFYLDLPLLHDYWSGQHGYHHTASSNFYAALSEALRLVLEEGLAARHARHRRHSLALQAGLAELGLEFLVAPAERLPQLLALRVPPGVDDLRVRKHLLEAYGLEIGGGLGPLKGKLWRIGLMGQGAQRRNVMLVLAALREALAAAEGRLRPDGVQAAQAIYAQQDARGN